MMSGWRSIDVVVVVIALVVVVAVTYAGTYAYLENERPDAFKRPTQCLQAPDRAMVLYALQPVAESGELWVCGTRRGNEQRVPAFFCYRMEDCAR